MDSDVGGFDQYCLKGGSRNTETEVTTRVGHIEPWKLRQVLLSNGSEVWLVTLIMTGAVAQWLSALFWVKAATMDSPAGSDMMKILSQFFFYPSVVFVCQFVEWEKQKKAKWHDIISFIKKSPFNAFLFHLAILLSSLSHEYSDILCF